MTIEQTVTTTTVCLLRRDSFIHIHSQTMKVKFIKSPTGKYAMGYAIGDEADIKDKDVALDMIETGYAIELKSKTKANPRQSTK